MSTILSVILLIYCRIIYMISIFIIMGMLEEWAVKYIMLHCGFFFCIICDNLECLTLNYKICPYFRNCTFAKIGLNLKILLYNFMVVICHRQFFFVLV